jgi:hypothetical protein
MARRMRLTLFVLAAAVGLMASSADARSMGSGGGATFGHPSSMAMTRTALLPHGFSHGRKLGFAGGHVPRGWHEGRKVGWHHGTRPPGLRR